MTFLKNAWYVACMPDEIEGKLLGRMIGGQRMVLFRNEDGQAAALDDFCPHRGAPLSLGSICKGKVVCGYHGLEVNCKGAVTSMPLQRVGGFPAVRSFPVVEKYGFVWIWLGDPAAADEAKLPDLAWAESSEWTYRGGLYHIDADYRLMIDNLMDLTHETYVHSSSIGQREIDETPCKTTTTETEVITSRFMDGISAPPFLKFALRSNGLPDDQPVDRWQICHFKPPSGVMIEVGVALAGHGGYNAPLDKKVSLIVVDFMTPETATSHWYFWGMARCFKIEDKALSEAIFEKQGGIFAEDKEVLELQQRNLAERPDQKLLLLNIDAGGVQSRRMLNKAIEAEQAI